MAMKLLLKCEWGMSSVLSIVMFKISGAKSGQSDARRKMSPSPTKEKIFRSMQYPKQSSTKKSLESQKMLRCTNSSQK